MVLPALEPVPGGAALYRLNSHCCFQGQLSIMAAQSVYDASMPRPSREMVRGEILPSAWILQPLTVEGKEITRVIYLAQVIHLLQLVSQHALI